MTNKICLKVVGSCYTLGTATTIAAAATTTTTTTTS
jgi:hypothetical protein